MYYKAGDTIGVRGVYAGFIQNVSAGVQVYFTIPLDKPKNPTVKGATLTGSMNIKTPAGQSTYTLSSLEAEDVGRPGIITFAYTGITTGASGTPATVWLVGNTTLTFT